MAADEKQHCAQGAFFVGEDGLKYAKNPFAEGNNIDQNLLTPRSENLETIIEPYTYCGHCDLHFESPDEFSHHSMEMHGQKKLLTCGMCEATFRRPDHLKRHVQSLHTFQKFLKCPVCAKDYKRKDILMKHIKLKHVEKPEIFKCRECQFQCNSLSDLEIHELSHESKVSRHQCSQCDMTFKRRDHMLRHVKSQHLKQVVVCPLCGQMYKRKDHVVRHVREKHQMGLLNGKLVKSSDFVS